MIELVWPWVLAAAPLPLLVYWLAPPARREEAALHVPFFATARSFESESALVRQRSLTRRLLMVLAWICLLLAAARPLWVGDPVELPTSGRDLMLAVDISGSMGTEDMNENDRAITRLAAVKGIVGDFVERRIGDRLGLILFGTKAYLQTPLTFDRRTVQALLMETPLGIAGGKTAIGDAIGLAVKRLQSRPAESRVLILLTDGVNNVGEVSPLQAAKLAATEGIRIHTIGFGADELIVPGLLFNRKINPSVELDEATLTRIADSTGGIYRRARNIDELRAIYEILDELEPIEQDAEVFRPIKALFHWPLSAALLITMSLALLHPVTPAFLRTLISLPRLRATRSDAG